MVALLTDEEREHVLGLLDEQLDVLHKMHESVEHALGICAVETAAAHRGELTLAAQLDAGDTVVMGGEPQVVVRVTDAGQRAGDLVPHVVVRTNCGVYRLPAARVMERAR